MEKKIELIDKLYVLLNSDELTTKNKMNILNNIIEIKLDNEILVNHKFDISKDLKDFITILCKLEDDTSLEHDDIKFNRIKEMLENFEYEKKILLLDFFIRRLKIENQDNIISKVQEIKNEFKLKNCFSKPISLKKLYSFIITFPFHKPKNLLLTFMFVYAIFYVFTFPAYIPHLEIFGIEYVNYSENFFFNHFLNTISAIFGVKTEFKLYPINSFGVLIAVLVKMVFYIVVLNSLLVKFLTIIKK